MAARRSASRQELSAGIYLKEEHGQAARGEAKSEPSTNLLMPSFNSITACNHFGTGLSILHLIHTYRIEYTHT